MTALGPLTVVSNRLPVVMCQEGPGWKVEPGAGGLVAAMRPILERQGGCWVGWPGAVKEEGGGWEQALAAAGERAGYALEPVVMSRDQYQGYYEGFANSVIWPLFHGFADRCSFVARDFERYQEVNQHFADATMRCVGTQGLVWVHDYHLFEVAARMRDGGHQGRLAFFLHISFPGLENYAKLPWRRELLRGLMAHDLVGFQTARDVRNFVRCAEAFGMCGVLRHEGGQALLVAEDGRQVEAGAFPIGMDFEAFSERASGEEVERRVRDLQDEIGPYRMLLGIDRLDYTKGLIHRLRAYELMLERHPELQEQVVFFQLVVPSRENVVEYKALKREFDRVVGRINGRFSTSGWQPIRYLYNRVDPVELAALYRLAVVALVTPLRDGMNLVAKEYCACQVDENGALVLSEFAGAAAQLGEGAVLVNPYDREATARAIARAVQMDEARRRTRMRQMRQVIAQSDVYWWAERFLEQAQEAPRPGEGFATSAQISVIGPGLGPIAPQP
ncbi:trehalose-6-phosphate synthase [Lujinxingia litoralis]|uniref:Glucosylglycerol-phosphate synthase n=1 Tax=Lujinxingia litoralis TaxID=2211119 RepID=A0A328C7U9_9DELT|nr:trehalose-6-phosphate synthase [Lujinxingia litoralis]RAL20635.1 trehalose-6-phosphate synthase [Lujinxingia litoralis]